MSIFAQVAKGKKFYTGDGVPLTGSGRPLASAGSARPPSSAFALTAGRAELSGRAAVAPLAAYRHDRRIVPPT